MASTICRGRRGLFVVSLPADPRVERGQSIRLDVFQAVLDAGERQDGLTTEEHDELRRLRRENRILQEEREILKKAAAFFATETDSRR